MSGSAARHETHDQARGAKDRVKDDVRRKAALDAVFGAVLPEDPDGPAGPAGRGGGDASVRSDDWLLENRPPHHG
ncbi:hypothetical protein ONR57_02005 [Hoyosella sp. YIM 151337]|uniref:hypothetical protein n=1 Tax=Hoyosella sp. YIM 151337 TaxID=2992742 RepID=UPI0022366883|nr:hypothetical protein [Hoyosella sp. YIM 151337]MCW4352069.1 hypothetical protein [Hoyosella sp. YIM 151337]